MVKVFANKKRILNESADNIEAMLIRNWDRQRGGDGKKMPPLKPKYKKWKEAQGKRGIRNIKLWGDMRASFTRRIKGEKVTVGFRQDQQKKAEGNAKHAPNFMATSEKMEQVTKATINKILNKK